MFIGQAMKLFRIDPSVRGEIMYSPHCLGNMTITLLSFVFWYFVDFRLTREISLYFFYIVGFQTAFAGAGFWIYPFEKSFRKKEGIIYLQALAIISMISSVIFLAYYPRPF